MPPFNNLIDPISLQIGGNNGDPIGGGALPLPMPLAPGTMQQFGGLPQPPAAPAMPPQQPPQLAPNTMIPEPTMSQRLINAGLAMIEADKNGIGLGGAMAAGMKAYNKTLEDGTEAQRKQRMEQLAEYELLGRIRERHIAEQAAARKLTMLEKLKEKNPDLADLIELDPVAASKIIAERFAPKDPLSPEGKKAADIKAGIIPAIDPEQQKGREEFDTELEKVLSYYDDLKAKGGIVSTNVSPTEAALINPFRKLANTEGYAPFDIPIIPGGQTLGRMFGTEEQQLRDKITGKRPILFGAIKKATGLTGGELNSKFEIENQLNQLGNLGNSYEANVELLRDLSAKFGTGRLAAPAAASPAGAVAPALSAPAGATAPKADINDILKKFGLE